MEIEPGIKIGKLRVIGTTTRPDHHRPSGHTYWEVWCESPAIHQEPEILKLRTADLKRYDKEGRGQCKRCGATQGADTKQNV